MRDDSERLRDMLEAIEHIERYAQNGRAAFDADELVRTWMVHHLQTIGEAGRALSPEFRANHEGVPWPKIIGTRHVLVHEYFGVDLDLVWEIVTDDLPPLKAALERLLEDYDT